MSAEFGSLTPDCILDAVESALGCPFTGLTSPLPSYVNRVYELQTVHGERVVAKFYRPGRWKRKAVEDEHAFVFDCAAAEIPVVAPLRLANGCTIGEADGILFSLFPKKSGREMELQGGEEWRRLGSLVGRIHATGAGRTALHRQRLHPEATTLPQIELLTEGGFMSPHRAGCFRDVALRIAEIALHEFEGVELQRIHGDCHRGNILERSEDGLMIIDFDDMAMGPPVQDIWLLLPDHAGRARREIHLILEGYEQFMEFDESSLRLVEILRAMRIIYFLAWCSTQVDDYKFRFNFPDWGSDMFWQREVDDLKHQLQAVMSDERLKTRWGR